MPSCMYAMIECTISAKTTNRHIFKYIAMHGDTYKLPCLITRLSQKQERGRGEVSLVTFMWKVVNFCHVYLWVCFAISLLAILQALSSCFSRTESGRKLYMTVVLQCIHLSKSLTGGWTVYHCKNKVIIAQYLITTITWLALLNECSWKRIHVVGADTSLNFTSIPQNVLQVLHSWN